MLVPLKQIVLSKIVNFLQVLTVILEEIYWVWKSPYLSSIWTMHSEFVCDRMQLCCPCDRMQFMLNYAL